MSPAVKAVNESYCVSRRNGLHSRADPMRFWRKQNHPFGYP